MKRKNLMAITLAAVTAIAPTSVAFAEEVAAIDGADVAKKSAEAAPDWQEYNNLIQEIKTTTDLVEREAKMHQAEDMLMETGAIVPLYFYNDIYLQKENVSGIYCNNYGYKYFMFADAGDSTTLRLNLASEPDKLDPALNSSVDGACLAVNSFGGLCTYNENGEVVMDFAESYEASEDGLTYVFTMRDGLKWSDGTDLNANDFAYSWNRAASAETGADYAYMFDPIAKNEDGTLNISVSEDGKTLTVNLIAPCAYFLDLCAFPTFYAVPQASVEGAEGWQETPGAWCQEAGFVTSGAYVLESWNHNESMVYVKNPNYYRADEVKIERLEFMLSADDTAIYAAYNAGNLDFADSVPNDEIQSLLDNPEFHIIDNLGTYYVCFNVNSDLFEGKTVEQAAAMRRGLSLLIDRDYIVENVGQTGQQLANTFIPAGMADGNGGEFRVNDDAYTYACEEAVGYYDPSYDAYDANLAEAIELLTEAGFQFVDDGNGNQVLSDETPIDITYIVNDGSGHIAIAEAMQQDFAVIGANLTIETNEWNVFLNERKAGNFDMARNGWLADFNDPINMLEMWTSGSGNNDVQLGK